MTGFDTSVLVRYIMQDDAKQSAAATRLIESLDAASPGFVPLVGVVELSCVLSSAYDLERGQVVRVFEALLRTKEILVEQAELVWKALRQFQEGGADFADCLIARSALVAGCERTVTFDRAAARDGGMTLLS